MAHTLPKVVALPEVPEYTDQIIFHNLGLPFEFDQERLGIHLRSLETARSAAGLGRLTIRGVYPEREEPEVSSVDSAGVATVREAVSFDINPLSEGTADLGPDVIGLEGALFDTNLTSDIKVDLTKREKVFRDSKRPNAALDPDLQAKYLNRSIRRGLIGANAAINANGTGLAAAGMMYGGLTTMEVSAGLDPYQSIAIDVLSRPVLLNIMTVAVSLTDTSYHNMKNPDHKLPPLTVLKMLWSGMRQSFFWGVQLDRLAMGAGVAATNRLVSARP